MTSSQLLSIGQVAESTGVTVRTLRYYDQLGLVEPTTRVGGKRRFDPSVTARVRFVRRAQRVGFSLEQIGDLLDDRSGRWNEMVTQKLDDLRAQRDELDSVIAELDGVQSCGCRGVSTCSSAGQWLREP